MSSWRSPRSLVYLPFFLAAAILAGPAVAQVTGTPAPRSQTSSSQPAAQPSEAVPYNTSPALRRDLALSVFAQISSSKVGNFIRSDTTGSGGGLLSYRYTYKPWLGYEANYGYTRYTDTYFYGVTRIPHNTHEFSVAYLLQGPKLSGFTPFLTLGGGALVFAPTGSASGSYSVDTKKLFVYGIGLQHAILNDRLGIRAQYRGLSYGVPSFGTLNLDTHRSRSSYEPSIGVFYHF